MSGSLRYRTIESGKFVLEQLYLNGEESFFTCKINVPSPRLDTVEEGTLMLDLRRMYDKPYAYEDANGDRHYRTRARFHGDTEEFNVDVIIRSRQADFVGATISMAGEALEIFKKFVER